MLPLLSLRLLICLGVLVVVVAATGVIGARHVRHPALLRATAALVSFALLLAGVAAAVNRHFALYRSWSSLTGLHSRDLVIVNDPDHLRRALSDLPPGVAEREHGQLLSLRIPGTASHLRAAGSLVYLPPQYGAKTTRASGFPVVEAFPGSPGRPVDYINGIRADRQLDEAILSGRLPPVIVVFPPSNLSLLRSLECTNTHDGLNDETYLTTDVRRWVDEHLSTDHRRWTALGYSSGGYCALDLTFRHPDLFARAISLDGYAHALDDHYARGLWGPGPAGRLARLEHSPDWWVAHHRPEPVDVLLSAGAKDHDAAQAALALWDSLRAQGWDMRSGRLVVESNGHHTFRDWERALIPSLVWALTSAPAESESARRRAAQALADAAARARHHARPR